MKFLGEMESYVAEMHAGGAQIVLCGDINITRTEQDVHPRERHPNLIGQRPEEREIFQRILSKGLVDVGRGLDPNNEELFTWWAPWRVRMALTGQRPFASEISSRLTDTRATQVQR